LAAVMNEHVWKLQDAKARLSEVIRRARTGVVQRLTVHGRDAVLVVDPERYDVKLKSEEKTLAGFVERSKKYRLPSDIEFEHPFPAYFKDPISFDDAGPNPKPVRKSKRRAKRKIKP
jgi:prevent-host-death family protein